MADPTEISLLYADDLLTPTHSIPPNIHCLNVSGSKGHFSLNFRPTFSPFDKNPDKKIFPLSNHSKYDELYEDAAKRALAKDKMRSYASAQKEKEVEKFKTDKKLSKAESFELFERLNKEAEIRQERIKMSLKMKEDQEVKVLKSPCINKSTVSLNQDVVTRLLQYGETVKRKNEELVQKKRLLEEEEIQKLTTYHKRIRSEAAGFSNFSTPAKNTSFCSSKNSQSPDKIIRKMQALAKVSPFNQRPNSAVRARK